MLSLPLVYSEGWVSVSWVLAHLDGFTLSGPSSWVLVEELLRGFMREVSALQALLLPGIRVARPHLLLLQDLFGSVVH